MKKLSLYAYLLLFAVVSMTLTSCGDDDSDPDPEPEPEPELNIIEWATDNGNYTLLLAAAEKAGLTPVLADPAQQFTIFGPTDPVFQGFLDVALGGATIDDLDAATLGGILTNHAYLGLRKDTDFAAGYNVNLGRVAWDTTGTITTSAFMDLSNGFAINGGTAATGGATVVEANFEASNGIIHSVDGVIVPPKLTTFVAVDPDLSMTLQALSRDDLGVDYVAAAGGNDLLTVFAPTNAGWEKYLSDNGHADIASVPAGEMALLIPKHIVAGGNVRSTDITDGMEVTNLASSMLTLNVAGDGSVSVSGTDRTGVVVEANVQSQNGVIHKIDNVIN